MLYNLLPVRLPAKRSRIAEYPGPPGTPLNALLNAEHQTNGFKKAGTIINIMQSQSLVKRLPLVCPPSSIIRSRDIKYLH